MDEKQFANEVAKHEPLSRLDRFAIAALPALIDKHGDCYRQRDVEICAEFAYRLARAMEAESRRQ